MLIRILIALISLSSFAGVADAAIWDSVTSLFTSPAKKAPTIKVLVVSNKDALVLEVKGKYNIFDPNTDSRLATRFMGKGNLIQAMQGGLKWGEEFPGVYQILIIPDDKQITTVVNGIEYRGKIYIYDVKGKLNVVNEVDLEDYLSSVLAYELKGNHSPETLAAIAIIERTNALFQSENSVNPYWNVDGKDVEYYGHSVTGRNAAVEQAISATKNMVMSKDKKIVEPFAVTWSEDVPPKGKTPFLSISEAESMASKGNDAAEILSKKFPNTTLQLTY